MNKIKLIVVPAVLMLVGAIMFFGSFSLESNLSDRQDWIETAATVTQVDYSEYDNTNYEAVERHEEPAVWGEENVYYEFIRRDGSVGTGKWNRRGLDTRDSEMFTEVGDSINVVYDPQGEGSAQGFLPDTSDYVGAYVMRGLGAVIVLASAVFIIYQMLSRKKATQ